jgi:hypothetical protein
MLRRDAFHAVGGFDTASPYARDWELWLRIADRFSTAAFAAIPQPQVMYRRVAGSLISNRIWRFPDVEARIIESRSLYKKSGLNKYLLRRRILAFNYFDLATEMRKEGFDLYFGYIFRSLLLWPFPFPHQMLPMIRYKFAAVMLLQHFGWWPNLFLSNATRSMGNPGTKKEG